jgi:chromosome segregation ATPase
MSQSIRNSLVVLAVLVASAAASAQPIVVIPKPGNGGWDVSYTRLFEKGDPATGTELSTTCRTLAAAKQEAARLQKWSQSMDAKSDWRLKKIYIEGEDAAGPTKDAAPRTPSLAEKVHFAVETANELKEKADKVKEKVDEAKEIYDRAKWGAKFLADPKAALEGKVEEWEKKAKKDARKLGDTLKEYGDNVTAAYNRAKDLKDDLLRMEKGVMDKSFKKVNDAVAAYNKVADDGAKFFDGKGGPFPRMKEVGPDTTKAVAEWRDARNRQFDLESRKDQLDKQKAALDHERTKLADEWKELSAKGAPDPADPKAARLRERLREYLRDSDKYNASLALYTAESQKLKSDITTLRDNSSDTNDGAFAKFLAGTKWEWKRQDSNREEIRRYTFNADGTYSLYDYTNQKVGSAPGVYDWEIYVYTYKGVWSVDGKKITLKQLGVEKQHGLKSTGLSERNYLEAKSTYNYEYRDGKIDRCSRLK